MSERPPIGRAPIPVELVVTADQAEGWSCIVCASPGQPGMDVDIFTAGDLRLWACPGACAETMFERLGLR